MTASDRPSPLCPTSLRPGPLDGLLVADFGRAVAGAQCSQVLADMGAEVIKIENPDGGDETRGFNPPGFAGESAFFQAYNRNKKSVALDLTTPDGREVARRLVDRADVLVENFSTGVMDRFGLDYGTVSRTNPRLVYCSISGYGRDGAFADRAGYDPVVQAESGYMATIGYVGQGPMLHGVPMVEITTGMLAVQGILAALAAREETGEGQYVETALYDVGTMMTLYFGAAYQITGENPKRIGNGSPAAAPVGTYQASDGPFQIAIAGQRVYEKLVLNVVKRPDLLEDPRFATGPARVQNMKLVNETFSEIFKTRTCDEWVADMQAAGVPGGPIRSIAEACAAPEVRGRGLIVDAPHPTAGTIPVVRNPIRFSQTPIREPVAGPLLGQHTRTVLADLLGYDDDRIAALAASGAVPAGT